jgi:hypothetical protein
LLLKFVQIFHVVTDEAFGVSLTENGKDKKNEKVCHSPFKDLRRENDELMNYPNQILSFNKIGMEFEINNYSLISVDLDVCVCVCLCMSVCVRKIGIESE